MSTYVSLYRRYRPQLFGDLVGQDHITRILQNAIESQRVAHAYLFCGPRGTGKTTTARLLAKALNCNQGPRRDPCNACPACERITGGSALDVIEIDAASNRGIDDIRDLREKVKYAPAEARYKVYVIDECHMLTTEAFNALLKTLEEPPPHVLFILATTDPQKVPATILSRCQRLDFRRGSVADLVLRLRVVAAGEGLEIEEEALTLVARAADGSWRDALSILEQIVAFGERRVTAAAVRGILGTVSAEHLFECAEALAGGNAAAALQIVARLAEEGKDIRDFLRGLVAHFRNLLLVSASGGAVLPDGATDEEARVLSEQASRFAPPLCIRAIEALSDAEREMRRDSQHRLLLELAMLRLMAAPTVAAAPTVTAGPPVTAVEREPSVAPQPIEARPVSRGEIPAEPVAPLAPSPTPAPPPAATPAAAAGLTLEDVQSSWALIAEHVRSTRLKGILRDVRPARAHGRDLLLVVRQGYTFHRDQLEKPENARAVQEAVRQVLGVEPTVRIRMEEESGSEAPSPTAAEAPPPATPPPGREAAPEADSQRMAPTGDEHNPYDAGTVSVKDVLDLFQGRVVRGKDER